MSHDIEVMADGDGPGMELEPVAPALIVGGA